MAYSLIYVTAGSRDEALDLARHLVGQRLLACANVLDSATSVYWWDGKLQEEAEAVLIGKTRTELVEHVIAAVKEKHSYDCPCVVALPIAEGNPAFLEWVEAETV